MILASRQKQTKYCHIGQRAYRCRWKVSRKKTPFSVRFLGFLLLNLICRPCGLFAKKAQGIPVFLCRVKLRAMLEWSSLYRVALLLSKINDDSDLDAEAAILYGKVGVRLFSKSSKRFEVISKEWVVQWQFTAWDQVQFCSCVACDCNLKALVWQWQACNRMNFNTESLVAYTSRAAFVGLSWVKRLGSLWFCFLKYPPRLCQKNSQQIMCQATYKAKTSRDKIATWSLEFSRASSSFFFCYEFHWIDVIFSVFWSVFAINLVLVLQYSSKCTLYSAFY